MVIGRTDHHVEDQSNVFTGPKQKNTGQTFRQTTIYDESQGGVEIKNLLSIKKTC